MKKVTGKKKEIPYGPVKILDGPHAGRIGYYDDDDTCDDADDDWSGYPKEKRPKRRDNLAIVYFGNFFVAKGYFFIPMKCIDHVTVDDLLKRREALGSRCLKLSYGIEAEDEDDEHFNVLSELHYLDSVLVDRMRAARYGDGVKGKTIFISHSSKDKHHARWLADDLRVAGHNPWLDEYAIKVGQSIPERVSDGIRDADFVLVLLSKNAIASKWVEREWHTKYWSEVEKGRILVLPALFEDCDIPELLRIKRYADFRNSYNDGLEDLLDAIDGLSNPA